MGRIGLRDYLSTQPREDNEFDCYYNTKRGIQVCVPRDFPFSEVIIRTRRWPFSGVRVYVDGRRWGWRGEPFSTGSAG